MAGRGGVACEGVACGVDAAALFAWAARSLTIREATRTPMPSLRPKRFGSMGKVYRERGMREQGPRVRAQSLTNTMFVAHEGEPGSQAYLEQAFSDLAVSERVREFLALKYG